MGSTTTTSSIERGDVIIFNGPSGATHQLLCADSCRPGAAQDAIGGKRLAAVVTDPPYSSGGTHTSARQRPTGAKYINDSGDKYLNFSGDAKDQRSWKAWCAAWLAETWSIAEPETYVMCFSDWRQLPTLTDAVQMGGWTWRGVCAWDKTKAARPPRIGYYRHQAEYVAWGTAGPFKVRQGQRVAPGAITCRVDRKKLHMTQKPVAVIGWLLSVLPDLEDDQVVYDPFAGSGTTAVAADALEIPSVLCEYDPAIATLARDRLVAEGFEVASG